MINAISYLHYVYFFERLFCGLFYVERFALEDGRESFDFHLSLEYREDALDWIVVRGVWRTKDVWYRQLIQPLLHVSTTVHGQVVHVDTYVLKEELVSQVLDELLELRDVHRSVEG